MHIMLSLYYRYPHNMYLIYTIFSVLPAEIALKIRSWVCSSCRVAFELIQQMLRLLSSSPKFLHLILLRSSVEVFFGFSAWFDNKLMIFDVNYMMAKYIFCVLWLHWRSHSTISVCVSLVLYQFFSRFQKVSLHCSQLEGFSWESYQGRFRTF